MDNVITPSSLWQGTASPGSRWTYEQLRTLEKEGVRDPETFSTAKVMRRPRHNVADWTMPPKAVATIVPRLAVTRNGQRAKIVTPAGAVQWVDVARG